jgi:hypothetical protein
VTARYPLAAQHPIPLPARPGDQPQQARRPRPRGRRHPHGRPALPRPAGHRRAARRHRPHQRRIPARPGLHRATSGYGLRSRVCTRSVVAPPPLPRSIRPQCVMRRRRRRSSHPMATVIRPRECSTDASLTVDSIHTRWRGRSRCSRCPREATPLPREQGKPSYSRPRPASRLPAIDPHAVDLRKWSRLGESNPRPTHYECVALTD